MENDKKKKKVKSTLAGEKAGKADYQVGYCKPPAQNRFSKENPGNWGKGPRKRRSVIADGVFYTRGAGPSIDGLVVKVANQLVKVRDGKGVHEVPAIEAVLQNMVKSALGGNRLAARDFAKLFQASSESVRADDMDTFKSFLEYKQGAERDLAFRKAIGQSTEDLLPHPADIKIDELTGAVSMHGPMDQEQRAAFEPVRARRDDHQIDVSLAAKRYRSVKSTKAKARALAEWHSVQVHWDWLNDHLPKSLQVELEDRSYALGASEPGSSLPDDKPRRR